MTAHLGGRRVRSQIWVNEDHRARSRDGARVRVRFDDTGTAGRARPEDLPQGERNLGGRRMSQLELGQFPAQAARPFEVAD